MSVNGAGWDGRNSRDGVLVVDHGRGMDHGQWACVVMVRDK
jgi:hypothetical protein